MKWTWPNLWIKQSLIGFCVSIENYKRTFTVTVLVIAHFAVIVSSRGRADGEKYGRANSNKTLTADVLAGAFIFTTNHDHRNHGNLRRLLALNPTSH